MPSQPSCSIISIVLVQTMKRRYTMKTCSKIISFLASAAVLTSSAVSCGKTEEKAAPSGDIHSAYAPDLTELPRGGYEVTDIGYLSDIENIKDISPLNDNRFLIISDTSEYGDAASQRLYIADDTSSTVKEITPELDLGATSYYSAMGTKDGRIFIAAVEPEYSWGKDPGHDAEENLPQDHLDFLFSHAKDVEYKLFETDLNGKTVSENELDIRYDPDEPITWLKCDDYFNDNIVLSATNVDNGEKDTAYYVVDKKGKTVGQLKNLIPYYGPTVKRTASDGRMCFVGIDYDSEEPRNIIYLYDKTSTSSSETISVRLDDLGHENSSSVLCAGAMGHGSDLLYCSSCVGVFAVSKDGKYENVIDYADLSLDPTDVFSLIVLDNDTVYVLAEENFETQKPVLYRLKKA